MTKRTGRPAPAPGSDGSRLWTILGGAAILAATLLIVGAFLAVDLHLGSPGVSPSTKATPTPDASDAVALPAEDPIEGVVVHVESTGIDSVSGFTLRAIDGKTYDFVIGRLQNASQFPPGHLAEHAANSEPILVTFEALGPTIFAVRLDDANPAPSSAPSSAPPAATGTPGPS